MQGCILPPGLTNEGTVDNPGLPSEASLIILCPWYPTAVENKLATVKSSNTV